MSNLLLPTLRQPRVLSWGWPVKKTPSFSTVVQTPASRRGEVRVSLTPVPVWNFELDLTYIYGDLNQTNTGIQQLLDFYQRVQGASDDWLFLDPYDNLQTTQLIGYGDGVNKTFQIGRSVNGLSFEPLQNVFPTTVQVNGVTVNPGPQASGNQWYSGLENVIAYSQDFTQTFWSPSSTAITGNATTAPDGSSTGQKVARSGTAAEYFVQQNFPATATGDSFTFSCYFLQGTAGVKGQVQVVYINANGIEIGTRAVGTATVLTASWQRLSVNAQLPLGTVLVYVRIYLTNTSTSGDFLYAWGAQMERNPLGTPSSYVMTTTTVPVTPRGLLTFTVAPAADTPITATFSFYYRCRFLDDEWNDLEEFLFQLWELKSLKFRSILL